MRTFVAVSHAGRSDGDWSLDDLAGGAGRVDVLCRVVNAAFFLSHGLRDDVEVVLVFQDPKQPTAIRLRGKDVIGLHPDERSIAGRIKKALKARPLDPWWEPSEPGIDVAPFDLTATLDDMHAKGRLVLLDPAGAALEDAALPADPVFVLSDHVPFTEAEYARLDERAAARISLGESWYHGHLVVGCVHWVMDRKQL